MQSNATRTRSVAELHHIHNDSDDDIKSTISESKSDSEETWPEVPSRIPQRWPRMDWFGNESDQPCVIFKERRLTIAPGVPPPSTKFPPKFKQPRSKKLANIVPLRPLTPSSLRGPATYPRNLAPIPAAPTPPAPCECCHLPPNLHLNQNRRVPRPSKTKHHHVLRRTLSHHNVVEKENFSSNLSRSKHPIQFRSQRNHNNLNIRQFRQPSSPSVLAVASDRLPEFQTLSSSSSGQQQSFVTVRTVFVDSPQANCKPCAPSELNQSFYCGMKHLFKNVAHRSNNPQQQRQHHHPQN